MPPSKNPSTPRRNSKPIRAALYGRVSTSDHGQDVELQLEELRQVAAQRGWETVEYIDEGVSGTKASRPALDRMMEDARAGNVDIVAIWKLDRLARSVAHLVQVAQSLQAWGVDLVSVRDAHIDTTSASGRFSLHILAAVAELEAELIRERVVAGVRRAQRAGRHCGRPRVQVNPKALVAARKLLNEGWSWREVAKATGVSKDTLRRRLAEVSQNPTSGGAR